MSPPTRGVTCPHDFHFDRTQRKPRRRAGRGAGGGPTGDRFGGGLSVGFTLRSYGKYPRARLRRPAHQALRSHKARVLASECSHR